MRVKVGPPEASLSLWMLEPDGGPRGTVLLLHGIRDSKQSQMIAGRALASRGWRAVMVDLRGHGRSSGEWLTYGLVESRDLQQLLDELEAGGHHLGPVGVVGCSYGGSVGLQLAAIDQRIKAVVAVAPFATVRDLLPNYAKLIGVDWLLSDSAMDNGIRLAGELTGHDLMQVDTAAAAGRSTARILLIHGQGDAHIPFEHSRRIAQAAGDRGRLIVTHGKDHVSIMEDVDGVVARETSAWLEQWLTP